MQENKVIHGYNMCYTDACLNDVYERRFRPVEFKQEELQLFEAERAYVLPYKVAFKGANTPLGLGGIVYENLEFCKESAIALNRCGAKYDFSPEKVPYLDKEVVFAGIFFEHWGHFILEEISRLYYFLEKSNNTLPIIYVADRPLRGNFLEFFELLGIDTNRLIWVEKITQFKKIYIPEVSMVAQKYYTKEYQKIFNTIKNKVEPLGVDYQNIFFTTRNFYKSIDKDWGEVLEIEKFFEKNGYKVLSPEKMSLKEQISVLKASKNFVAISGTLPHNILFANPDLNTVILNKSCVINYQQTLIDAVVGKKSLYIDCHLSFFPAHVGSGPFFLFFSDNLIQFAKDNNMILPNLNRNKLFHCFIKKFTNNFKKLIKEVELNYTFRDCEEFYYSKIHKNFFLKMFMKLRLYELFNKKFYKEFWKYYPIYNKRLKK